MRLEIADRANRVVSTLVVEGDQVHVSGPFPGGLTAGDLSCLGFVRYETDDRGEICARVQEVPPSETLDYVRAVLDALPPGYHVARVESQAIEEERCRRRARFEAELERME